MASERRLRSAQLGESWASDDYEREHGALSDNNEMVGDFELSSGSDLNDGSGVDDDSEVDDEPTPLPHHAPTTPFPHQPSRVSSAPRSDPKAPPSEASASRHLLSCRSPLRPVPSAPPVEPSFIMPSMTHDTVGASFSRPSPSRVSSRPRHMKRSGSEYGRYDAPAQSSPSKSALRRRYQAPNTRRFADTPVQDEKHPWIVPQQLWAMVAQPALGFVLSVVEEMFQIAKPFIAWAMILWLLYVVMFGGITSGISTSIARAMSPLCYLPGTSYLNLPFCAQAPSEFQFQHLMDTQDEFENILVSVSEMTDLPYEMRNGEFAVRDIRNAVHHANIPSKHELLFEVGNFIDTIQQASRDLIGFNVHVSGTADRILIANRATLRTLLNVREKEASRGAVSRWFSKFSPRSMSTDPQDVVVNQYLRHMREVEKHITKVILEGDALYKLLMSLDDHLDSIGRVVEGDNQIIKDDKNKLLASLWTRLGGNKAELSKFQQNLGLLSSLRANQHTAWRHVSATLIKLNTVTRTLDELREQVGAPGARGIDLDGLEQHMESIQLNVDRLEQARGVQQSVEQQADNKYKLLAAEAFGETDPRKLDRGTLVVTPGAKAKASSL